MKDKMREDLEKQLRQEGITDPQDIRVDKPTDLAEAYWGDVSGGFGQVFFAQGFHQHWPPGSGEDFIQDI